MKRLILILIATSFLQVIYSQVETKFFPNKDAFRYIKYLQDQHLRETKIIELPSFDSQKMINEDNLNKKLDVPFRFGKGFDTEITLTDGEWANVEGGRLWSMRFRSKGAYSINFVFDSFYLPENAQLYITNADGTMLYGPVTSRQNTKNGYFLTDLIQGDNVIIYLFEPVDKTGQVQLTIKKVVHAYKNLFPFTYGNLGSSGTCNNDVNCFPAWDQESDAVALVLLPDGTKWCSGSLLMTANQNFKPYFLSAFHCIDVGNLDVYQDEDEGDGVLESYEITNAENWMFKFQYKMTTCGGSTATTGIAYNGAGFRAAWNTSDFALMEMDLSPLGDNRFSWLGWDRSGSTPTSGTGIHHPSGDVMKISFEENQFQKSSWGGTTNHWLLFFDDGVVEHGSSGSPIIDQDRRVVGQLHGNQSYVPWVDYCYQPRAEYGCFHLSWTGDGTDSTRLSNWLDPSGTGTITTNTSMSPYITGPTLVCSSGAEFTLNNLPDVDSIIWITGPDLEITSDQGTSACTISATGSGSSWIQAELITACDTITLPAKIVWAGRPYINPSSIQFECIEGGGYQKLSP